MPSHRLNVTTVDTRGPKGDPGDPGADGAPGAGVVAGGTAGQVLVKSSGVDFDTEWSDAPPAEVDYATVTETLTGTATAKTVNPATLKAALPYVNVKSYGAVGDGTTDDTAAIQNAINAVDGDGGGTVFFPAGTYRCTAGLDVPSYLSLRGEGKASIITCDFSGTLFDLPSGRREVKWEHLWVKAVNSTCVLFALANVFRCSWRHCYISGTFVGPASAGTVTGQIGVKFTSNSGDNVLLDCDITNLTVGIWAESIQNGIVGCKIGTNNIGLYAISNGGMAIGGYTDFVGGFAVDGVTPLVDRHIWINGATGQWWLSNVWIEGCTTGIDMGAGSSGPIQFGLSNVKIAATTTCLKLNAGRNPSLTNVQLAGDRANAATPTPVTIDTTNCPQGSAMGLDSLVAGFDASIFPVGWMVHVRGGSGANLQVPNNVIIRGTGALQMRRTNDDALVNVMRQVTGNVTEVSGGQPTAAGGTLRLLSTGIQFATSSGTTTGPRVLWGSATPEGAITAPVGSVFMRSDGGAATTFYVKESGTGNTGWVAVGGGGGGLTDGDKGDITVGGSGTTLTIDNGVVSLAKMANLAQDQVIGRVTASTGVPETFTVTAAARTVLDDTTTGAMLTTLGAQPLDSDLTDIALRWNAASASGPANLHFREDTDNGLNEIILIAPASIAADVQVVLPAANDTLVGKATTDTLTNKSIDLASNTLTGTVAQFNTALASADFYTTGGTDVAVADGGTGASTAAAGLANLGGAPIAPTINVVAATGATEAIDWNTEVHNLTMDQNCTFSFSNLPASGTYKCVIVRIAGAFTPTLPASCDFPGGTPPTYATPSVYKFECYNGTDVLTTLLGSGYA